MGKPKNPQSEIKESKPPEKTLEDSISLAILEKVEAEVEKRIRKQEKWYWIIILVIVTAIAAFVITFWKVTIPEAVDKALTSTSALSTQDKLTNILSSALETGAKISVAFNSVKAQADDANRNLNQFIVSAKTTAEEVKSNLTAIPILIDTNIYTPLGARLEQLKQQDNILLVDDLPKMFVRELVTNLVEENSMVLSYEPIPSTVKIYAFVQNPGSGAITRYFLLDNYGYCQGRSIYFTNKPPTLVSQVLSHVQNGGVTVEYVRKSLR